MRDIVVMTTLVLLVGGLACRPGAEIPSDADPQSLWRGTIETEGDVTRVRNESGSVWGGAATLVEETSIGVAEGPEEQLLGYPAGVALVGDSIFVLDLQTRTVRSYDADTGDHLADCGGPGQGPGEIDPSAWTVDLASDGDARVFVSAGAEVEIYDAGCRHVDTWPGPGAVAGLAHPLTVDLDGRPWLPVLVDREGPSWAWTYGMQELGKEGPVGEPLPQPTFDHDDPGFEIEYRMNDGGRVRSRFEPPYSAGIVWTMLPSRAMAGGVSSSYSYRVVHADGRLLEVERVVDPVRLESDERDWHARRARARLAQIGAVDPPDSIDVPEVKPAFDAFIPTRDGRLWVLRAGPGERIAGCEPAEPLESTCWRDRMIVDVFEGDGRYLGRVEPPPEVQWTGRRRPWIDGDTIVAMTEDEAGTPGVKRFRLELPSTPGQDP